MVSLVTVGGLLTSGKFQQIHETCKMSGANHVILLKQLSKCIDTTKCGKIKLVPQAPHCGNKCGNPYYTWSQLSKNVVYEKKSFLFSMTGGQGVTKSCDFV
jgi:hypothetical protein